MILSQPTRLRIGRDKEELFTDVHTDTLLLASSPTYTQDRGVINAGGHNLATKPLTHRKLIEIEGLGYSA